MQTQTIVDTRLYVVVVVVVVARLHKRVMDMKASDSAKLQSEYADLVRGLATAGASSAVSVGGIIGAAGD